MVLLRLTAVCSFVPGVGILVPGIFVGRPEACGGFGHWLMGLVSGRRVNAVPEQTAVAANWIVFWAWQVQMLITSVVAMWILS